MGGFVLWCSSFLEGRWEFGSCLQSLQPGNVLREAVLRDPEVSLVTGTTCSRQHRTLKAPVIPWQSEFCLVLVPKNNLEEGELRLEHKARCQSLCQSWCHRGQCPGCAPSQLCLMGLRAGCCCRVLQEI